MLAGKLFKSLRLLDSRQLGDFEKFLSSPYFLKRKNLPAVYKELMKHYPEFSTSKKEVYTRAFPGSDYNEVLMRKYISEIYSMLTDYLAISSFQKDEMTFSSKLIDRLIELNDYEEARKTATEMLLKLEKSDLRNEKYYYNKYIFERYSKTISNLVTNLDPDTDWKNAMDGFVNYSALTVLQFYYIILNDNRFRKEKSEINLDVLNGLVHVFEKSVIPTNPAAVIFYNLVNSFLQPREEKYYKNIREMLVKHKAMLDKNELAAIYTYLHNYCFVKVDNGDLGYLKERFEIVNEVLANGFHLKDGYMVPDMYISMANNALMLEEYNWAEAFIRKYKDNLPGEEKASYGNLAFSALYMFKGEYETALKYLSRVKFRKYYDKSKIKSLNLMIYYEAGYFEEAFFLADSFRHFISKHKSITPYVRERTNNFVKQVLQLINFRLKKAEKPEIKGFATCTIMYRPWLIQKLQELRPGNKQLSQN